MNFKDLFTTEEENDEEEYRHRPYTPQPARPLDIPSGTRIALFEPRSFEEATAIAMAIKKGNSATVNLHRLTKEYAQRTIDFLTGVVYALDGRIEKIGHNLIMCSPKNVTISGSITMDNTAD